MSLYRLSLKNHGRLKGKTASSSQHAAYILRDVTTPETATYVRYVLRQSRTTKDREDLAHAEWHNLPAWADDNPVSFFLTAERYEGANRRVSSSIDVSLPRELSQEAQIALMQDYCQSQFGRHPYVVALHDAMGTAGTPNPHFHVTWSERIADGVEREPALYFKRPPHGAGKDPMFHDRAWLPATRMAWADLANMALEREGITDAYVDPRSLSARGIGRAPERYGGPRLTIQAKLGRTPRKEWLETLEQRKHHAAFRALEQAIAADAWKARKEELGIEDVLSLDRAAFVEQVAQRTREQALHPPRRKSYAELEADERAQHEAMRTLEEMLQTTERSLAYAARLEQREQTHRPTRTRGARQQEARVRRGYDPRGRIFDRGEDRHGRAW